MRRTRRLFFIGLGLTTLVAVGSYWWQLPGLAGQNGIAPIGSMMDSVRHGSSFFQVPTLLWISSSDVMLHLLCAIAFFSGVLLVIGLSPRIACVLLWASWLSLVQLGHPFLAFQWDVLLIEAAFCSTFFAPPGFRPRLESEPEPHAAFRWVMIVLACKVTLQSGIVKLISGDPTWRDLTALTYHWWSQPLPTWSSVMIAALPSWVQKVMCFLMFGFELVIPVMALGPRRVRIFSGLGLMVLQAGLFAAGNYSFYNVLTLVLAIPLLDDAVLPGRPLTPTLSPLAQGKPVKWVFAIAFAALSVATFSGWRIDAVSRLHTINAYGAFAVMTKNRAEIILEGSTDGATWLPYEFPWKPGDVTRRPGFIAPWQPRLDWQMWFAALGSCGDNPWVLQLQQRLLTNTPAVLELLERNPFPDAAPRYLRTRVFEYRFAPWSEKGVWWTRTERGPYCPSVMLGTNGTLQRAF